MSDLVERLQAENADHLRMIGMMRDQMADNRDTLALANARIARLEEALKDYAETFCEFGDDHAGCGKFDAMTCSGCAARAALKGGA